MFGQHDDTNNQTDNTAAAAATDEQPVTALPPTPLPPAEPVAGPSPSYIATDDHGQPDDSGSVPSLPVHADNLLDIKQEALKELSPLVGHLNQTPEEKFRTTMMMIQASDDQSLITQAYDAAKEISDEKTRAQALLDIINEINYFTQQHDA